MTPHPNSLYAYWQMRDAGELQPKEMMVLQALEQFGPLTRQELESAAGMRLSCVCGRVHKLMEKNLITEDGNKYNAVTRKNNALLRLLTESEKAERAQMDLLEAA